MRYGLNKDNERTFIDDAIRGESYFCPTCNAQLVIKRGQCRVHHFAHYPNKLCTDNWHYEEMSEWHSDWQNRFPSESQEVVMTHNGQTHRADVFIDNTVVEFQHSPISKDEFEERNNFYTSLGYKVVWVFDLIDDYECGTLAEPRRGKFDFVWSRPRNNFVDYDIRKNKEIDIYFHISDEVLEDDNGETTRTPILVQVVGTGYTFKYIKVNYINGEQKHFFRIINYDSREYLFDDMYSEHCIGSVDHAHLFVGCPINNNSTAATEHGTKDAFSCADCKYCKNYYECHYAEIVANIPYDAFVKKIVRNKYDLITDIIVERNGKTNKVHIDRMPLVGKNIKELWNSNQPCSSIIVYNIESDCYFKITSNPNETDRKYRKVYGYFSKEQFGFNDNSTEVYGFFKPIWFLIKASKTVR